MSYVAILNEGYKAKTLAARQERQKKRVKHYVRSTTRGLSSGKVIEGKAYDNPPPASSAAVEDYKKYIGSAEKRLKEKGGRPTYDVMEIVAGRRDPDKEERQRMANNIDKAKIRILSANPREGSDDKDPSRLEIEKRRRQRKIARSKSTISRKVAQDAKSARRVSSDTAAHNNERGYGNKQARDNRRRNIRKYRREQWRADNYPKYEREALDNSSDDDDVRGKTLYNGVIRTKAEELKERVKNNMENSFSSYENDAQEAAADSADVRGKTLYNGRILSKREKVRKKYPLSSLNKRKLELRRKTASEEDVQPKSSHQTQERQDSPVVSEIQKPAITNNDRQTPNKPRAASKPNNEPEQPKPSSQQSQPQPKQEPKSAPSKPQRNTQTPPAAPSAAKEAQESEQNTPTPADTNKPGIHISGKQAAGAGLAAVGITGAALAARHIYKKRKERKEKRAAIKKN